MTINELYDIADRLDQLVTHTYELGWNRQQLMYEIDQVATKLREEADDTADQLEKQANEFEYMRQFDYDMHSYLEG